jgi:hypothetical protein
MNKRMPASRRFLIAFFALVIFLTSSTQAYAVLATSIVADSLGAIAAVSISCRKDQIARGMKTLFKTQAKSTVKKVAGQSVPVSDVDNLKANSQAAASSEATTRKLTCTNAIEKVVAQIVLKKLTLATVNWINRGFQGGGSLFPKDPSSFFQELHDQLVQKFVLSIGFDPKNYPFGRIVLQSLINNISSTFEMNAAYSLNQVIAWQYPGMDNYDFRLDLAIGGWDAFLAQQLSNNNPYGFMFAAQDELAARTQYTSYSPAQDLQNQLTRSGGFLDLKRCVAPLSATGEDAPAIAAQARKDLEKVQLTPGNEEAINSYKLLIEQHTCVRWETQTPGSIISSSLTEALGSPFRQLELGQDLTTSLTAIFNALTNQLVHKGLSYISEKGVGKSETSSTKDYTNNQSYGLSNVSTKTNGFNDDDPATWQSEDDTFNVFADIPRLIKNETNDPTAANFDSTRPEGYQQMLKKQNAKTTELISAIYTLDYCLPGPNPIWETTSQIALEEKLNGMSGVSADRTFLGINTSGDNHKADVFGTLVGNAISFGQTLPQTPEHLVSVAHNNKVESFESVATILETIFARYQVAVGNSFTKSVFLELNPALIQQNKKEFANIESYKEGIKENEELLTDSESMVSRLESLTKRISDLPNKAGYPGLTAPVPLPGKTTGVEGAVSLPALKINGVDVRDYAQDLAAVTNITNLNQLTAYQIELKRINSTFSTLAPDIHGTDNIIEEDQTLDSIQTLLIEFTGEDNMGGYIRECVDDMFSPEYKGPTARITPPEEVKWWIWKNVLDNFPASGSFLPGWHYAQGVGINLTGRKAGYYPAREVYDPTTKTVYNDYPTSGADGDPIDIKKLIRNDDVVTIDNQPTDNAFAGFENLIQIY